MILKRPKLKKTLVYIACLCALMLTSCQNNKVEKNFARSFAEAVANKDTVKIDSMMGTKGAFLWSETQIAEVNPDSLKLEEAGEHEFKATLNGNRSFIVASSAGNDKNFHVLQPKGLFSVDPVLVNALKERGEVKPNDDDATIFKKVKDVKDKATKMDGKIYVGNSGYYFYFLKRIARYSYDANLWQYNLKTGKTKKIYLIEKLNDIGIVIPETDPFTDYAVVGKKLVLATIQMGLDLSPTFLVDIDLETLKMKELMSALNFTFSKDQKKVTITDITEMMYDENGMQSPRTAEKTLKLTDIIK